MARKKGLSVAFSPDEYTLNSESVKEKNINESRPLSRVGQQEKRPLGRPPGKRTVGKDKGFCTTVYISHEMKSELKSCSFFAEVDQSDIIRTSIGMFLRTYCHEGKLDKDGIALVRKHIVDTTEY